MAYRRARSLPPGLMLTEAIPEALDHLPIATNLPIPLTPIEVLTFAVLK
jgi:hypothetical protein